MKLTFLNEYEYAPDVIFILQYATDDIISIVFYLARWTVTHRHTTGWQCPVKPSLIQRGPSLVSLPLAHSRAFCYVQPPRGAIYLNSKCEAVNGAAVDVYICSYCRHNREIINKADLSL